MRIFVATVLLLFASSRVWADPVWVPPKGTLHTAFSITGAMWDQFLQEGTQSHALPGEIAQYEMALYGEYVPIENLSFDILFPVVIVQKKFVFLETNPFGEITGVQTGSGGEVRDINTNAAVGDVYLGGKYIFWEKYVSLGARIWTKIPGTYDYGYIVNAPGDGQSDFGFGLLTGKYFTKLRLYFRGSLAYVVRLAEPNNQMELLIEPGVNITRYLTARFMYQFTNQFGGEQIQFFGFPNYYPEMEEDTHKIAFGLTAKIVDSMNLFGMYQQTIAGKNTANIRGFTLGVDLVF